MSSHLAAEGLPKARSTPHRILSFQILTLVFLMVAGIVNFLDRSSLSIANTTIREELGLSATQIGVFLSAFSFAYGLSQLPAGLLLDRFGPRKVLGIGMFFWSLAQLLMGVVSGFWTFIALRIGLGMGEAPFMPTGVKAVNDWFPPRDRGLPMGIVNSSTTIGQALAPPLLAVIMIAYGWRSMFVLIGALGVGVAVIWYLFYRDRTTVDLNAEETGYLNADAPAAEATRISFAEWGGLFARRSVWGMIFGFSGVNYTVWLYIAWLPGYLQAARHLSLAQTGWVAAIPFLFGAVGMLFNGVVADALAARGLPLMKSRKVLICLGMICSALCTVLVANAATTTTAVLFIGLALFFIHFAGTSSWGLVQVATPPRMVASVSSIQNFGSFVCASFAPIVTGWVLDRTGAFDIALFICSGVTLLGALSYWFVVKEPIHEAE